MGIMASLVTTCRMQQCFNVLIDIYREFLLLFYRCVLLEIKLTTTTTTTTTVLLYYCTTIQPFKVAVSWHGDTIVSYLLSWGVLWCLVSPRANGRSARQLNTEHSWDDGSTFHRCHVPVLLLWSDIVSNRLDNGRTASVIIGKDGLWQRQLSAVIQAPGWQLWYDDVIKWKNFTPYWPFVEFTGLRWIPRTKASDAELWCFLWSAPEK